MHRTKNFALIGALAAILMIPVSSVAQLSETVLYTFTGGADGRYPYAGLVSDAAGNLYGTTINGGSPNCYLGCGVVFELSPSSGGGWTETVLHSFTGGGDGENPQAGLIFDSSGNLYGTTAIGGSESCAPNGDCGTVFELSPVSGGGWSESILHVFKGGRDGTVPAATMIFDKAGNLYGTTVAGGGSTNCLNIGCGTVFELTASSGGVWKETVLHAFEGANGWGPQGTLVFDGAGSLYGTTYQGGPASSVCYYGCGVVFKLAPSSSGWRESIIHAFTGGNDGSMPMNSGVIFDQSGDLYGTTFGGGVYKLTPGSKGGWIEATIHSFTNSNDGQEPYAGLVFDASGNLYGTTWLTVADGAGSVFELTLTSKGWRESALNKFTGGSDGGYPVAPVMVGASGSLYGTTTEGGVVDGECEFGCGVVFELSPASTSK